MWELQLRVKESSGCHSRFILIFFPGDDFSITKHLIYRREVFFVMLTIKGQFNLGSSELGIQWLELIAVFEIVLKQLIGR